MEMLSGGGRCGGVSRLSGGTSAAPLAEMSGVLMETERACAALEMISYTLIHCRTFEGEVMHTSRCSAIILSMLKHHNHLLFITSIQTSRCLQKEEELNDHDAFKVSLSRLHTVPSLAAEVRLYFPGVLIRT
ncbi:Hypothetical predicted protein [Xyrichtys novacula]|uniref:Uncharacterized protein n=1 Tax=Xyrichtys novacula TaxID=13765 RepID=A0AAV1FEK7_XYRNO|nr:Hypothetical predicted protein [Xyrichtys novacula]